MVLIAAKMTDRLQVCRLLMQHCTINLRIMGCRCVSDTAIQLDYQLSPARMLSSVLDKDFFRRYSERQIWCTTVGDMH
jgi:hypothetical protein